MGVMRSYVNAYNHYYHHKKNNKAKTMLWNFKSPKVTPDGIISHDKYAKPHSHMNWFKSN
jgi:hypothetical protein